MTRPQELPETQAILARIKAGEEISILVGQGHEAVQMVLTAPAQEWLRCLFVKITEPTPPQANAAALAHRTAQSKGPVSEAEPKLKDGTNI